MSYVNGFLGTLDRLEELEEENIKLKQLNGFFYNKAKLVNFYVSKEGKMTWCPWVFEGLSCVESKVLCFHLGVTNFGLQRVYSTIIA